MNTQSQHVLESALALPETERAQIAASLILSLNEKTDEDTDAAWDAEIRRRLASIDDGDVKLVPWVNLMREMHERGHG